MRRIKRTPNFEISITLNQDDFIQAPRSAQRNALVNQLLKETTMNANALHEIAKDFVPGQTTLTMDDRTNVALTDDEIMEDWQLPLMKSMAEVVTEKGGDILEIGFGKGVASSMIQDGQISSHTIIECNDSVIDRFYKWKENFPGKEIKVVKGLWQDTIDQLGLFDGVFFHTYPLNEKEYLEYVQGSATFAEHFFSSAAAHLKQGGLFTYMTNEIDSLSRPHQRALFQYFSSFEVSKVKLEMPNNVKDTWWANSMVIVKAVK